MLKRIFILLNITAALQTHAMNKPMELEKTNSIVNSQTDIKEFLTYLTALPTDVKRYIIQFLPFDDSEFEDEFITRTKNTIKKRLPGHYYYKNFQKPQLNEGGRGQLNIFTGLCPHNINVAVLNGNHLQIINTRNDSIIHTEEITPQDNYTHIAVSRNAHMFATIDQNQKKHTSCSGHETTYYVPTNTLTVKNITTQKTETVELSHDFRIPNPNHPSRALAFKKEGTHIILHGIDNNKAREQRLSCSDQQQNPVPHQLIIPITVNGPYNGLDKLTLIYVVNKIMAKSITDNPQ